MKWWVQMPWSKFFWMSSFKPAFLLSSFTFIYSSLLPIKELFMAQKALDNLITMSFQLSHWYSLHYYNSDVSSKMPTSRAFFFSLNHRMKSSGFLYILSKQLTLQVTLMFNSICSNIFLTLIHSVVVPFNPKAFYQQKIVFFTIIYVNRL